MSKLHLLLFAAFLLLPIVHSTSGTDTDSELPFPAHKVLQLVRKACPRRLWYCPKLEFLGDNGDFDEKKVVSSKAFHHFNAGNVEPDDAWDFFQKEFCCGENECLDRCGIWDEDEREIVKNFRFLYRDVFDLGIEEINQFKSAYTMFIERPSEWEYEGPGYASIEELYDVLAEHEKYIWKKLEERS